MTPPAPKQVSDSQKKAMAKGRADGRTVKNYLEGLEQNKPKRGRKRTPAGIRKKLAELDSMIENARPLNKVGLVQQRMDLSNELDKLESATDMADLEKGFISVAKGYGERKGIGYAAWREVGVPATVLKEAGITRAS